MSSRRGPRGSYSRGDVSIRRSSAAPGQEKPYRELETDPFLLLLLLSAEPRRGSRSRPRRRLLGSSSSERSRAQYVEANGAKSEAEKARSLPVGGPIVLVSAPRSLEVVSRLLRRRERPSTPTLDEQRASKRAASAADSALEPAASRRARSSPGLSSKRNRLSLRVTGRATERQL